MKKITASGKYDLTMEEYHGQPTDTLSMSSSDAILLNELSPAHLQASWMEENDNSKAADRGTIIHSLVLEPHRTEKAIVVVKADDWRSGAARNLRDSAREAGKTPILEKDLAQAYAAVEAVMDHPVAAALLKEGEAERSWFAKDKATGFYKKARPDFFNTGRVIIDLKTVAKASPEFLQRRVWDGGWYMQAPWYCDVVERVDGAPAAGYCWICVEQEPPHAVVVRKPPYAALMHGHRLNEQAFALFAKCAAANDWPAYGNEIEELGLPDFAYYRLEESALRTEGRGMEAVKLAREVGGHVSPFG